MEQCKDSKDRQYQPCDIVAALSTLDFIRSGMNLCIFGASDSGKIILPRRWALRPAASSGLPITIAASWSETLQP